MNYEVTEEKVLRIAKRYGLKAKKSDSPGFFINGKKISIDELYADLFGNQGEGECVMDGVKLKEELRNFFNSKTREEIKDFFAELGFKVEDGEGEIIYTDTKESFEKEAYDFFNKMNDDEFIDYLKSFDVEVEEK